jgi:hypothetical protein
MKPDRNTITRTQTPTLAVMESPSDLHEQIRRRAYELFEQRGRIDGHEVSDWLQAESEVAQKKAKAVTA